MPRQNDDITSQKEQPQNISYENIPAQEDDFVAEVVSPSSVKKDYLIKLNKYWNAKVREYWIIDPEKQTVSAYCFEPEEAFNMTQYTFGRPIPVRIFEGLEVDFSGLL